MAEPGIKLTWLGHAATKIETASGKAILIDPWVQTNPATPDEHKQQDQVDLILISHGHDDNMGDAVDIAKSTGATVICNFEIAHYLHSKGVENTIGMNTGGTVDWNGTQISMVDAVHSSSIVDGDQLLYAGNACGYVLRFDSGFTLYLAGDTDVFSSMELIGRRFEPDAAVLPIGGHFTMDPKTAAEAIRLLGVTTVIPVHYGTFDLLAGRPDSLEREAADVVGLKVVALEPGESVTQGELV
jgi:L-ascorbate metabolism protein UlaG (beta-lactamase superfamily)